MACFLVPVAEAVITTVTAKIIEKKEKRNISVNMNGGSSADEIGEQSSVPFSRKLRWLGNMLWGGSALLAFEHVWHGEVVPWFPFLTAAADPADALEMLHEMATVGVTMTLLVTAVWLGMLGVSAAFERRANKARSVKE